MSAQVANESHRCLHLSPFGLILPFFGVLFLLFIIIIVVIIFFFCFCFFFFFFFFLFFFFRQRPKGDGRRRFLRSVCIAKFCHWLVDRAMTSSLRHGLGSACRKWSQGRLAFSFQFYRVFFFCFFTEFRRSVSFLSTWFAHFFTKMFLGIKSLSFFTEFYRVSLEPLLDFTGFYLVFRVLLGFTEFYWVSLDFT